MWSISLSHLECGGRDRAASFPVLPTSVHMKPILCSSYPGFSLTLGALWSHVCNSVPPLSPRRHWLVTVWSDLKMRNPHKRAPCSCKWALDSVSRKLWEHMLKWAQADCGHGPLGACGHGLLALWQRMKWLSTGGSERALCNMGSRVHPPLLRPKGRTGFCDPFRSYLFRLTGERAQRKR